MTTRTIDYLQPRDRRLTEPPAARSVGHLRRGFRFIARAILAILGLCLCLGVFLVLIDAFVPVFFTPLIFFRATEALFDGHLPNVEKEWVSLDKISPKLQHAVIAAEDMKFYEHNGFDWEAIEKAYKQNSKINTGREVHQGTRQKVIRGASTISQQTAKNVFLWPTRSWVRKGLETGLTAMIELVWPKQRILEVYLNVVELGDGVYGAEAAAQKYFHKSASTLTSSEAALMAAVLPNPRRFSIAKPSAYIRFRQTMIQHRMSAAAETVPVRNTLATSASKN